MLRDGGEVGLVLDENGRRQPLLEDPDQSPVPGGQLGGVAQFAGGRGDQSRGPDADAVQGDGPRLAGGALQEGDGLFDGGPGPGLVGDGQGGLREGGPQQVRDDHGDAAGAHVEGGEVGPAGDDPVQLGVGSPADGAGLADDMDQTGALEPFDQVGHGRAGESGQVLELCGRQRAVLLEQLQGEAVVDGPSRAR